MRKDNWFYEHNERRREEINEAMKRLTPEPFRAKTKSEEALLAGPDSGNPLDLPLGLGKFSGNRMHLWNEYRDQHVYIIGRSGMGKTLLMRNFMYKDLVLGNGFAFLTPELETIRDEILPYIPKSRIKDVILFDPADKERPIPFNLLAFKTNDDFDTRVSQFVTAFERSFGAGANAPEMMRLLSMVLYVLCFHEGVTLLDVRRLLDRNDASFREKLLEPIENETVEYFWRQEYSGLTKDAHVSLMRRIDRLTMSQVLKRTLSHPAGCIDFRWAIDHKKILLFNLSEGVLGQGNATVLGQLIITCLQQVMESRADVHKSQRVPFYVYVDEFQKLVGVAEGAYSEFLTRARKYGMGVTLAHPQLGHLSPSLVNEILGCVSSMVMFSCQGKDARKLLEEMNIHDLEIDSREIVKMPKHEMFVKTGERSFFCNLVPPDQMNYKPIGGRAEEVISASRMQFGKPYKPSANEGLSSNGGMDEKSTKPKKTKVMKKKSILDEVAEE
jgi:hypothetical protein